VCKEVVSSNAHDGSCATGWSAAAHQASQLHEERFDQQNTQVEVKEHMLMQQAGWQFLSLPGSALLLLLLALLLLPELCRFDLCEDFFLPLASTCRRHQQPWQHEVMP
jgi:hypothetical protein